MIDQALNIVREFLRMGDPRVRGNAVTALGALATKESIAQLVDCAARDQDATVRQRAERELAELTGEAAQHLADVADARLRDKEDQGAVYALLGRLRGHGKTVAVSRPPRRERLLLAFAVGALSGPDRRWRWRWRPALSGALGGVAGGILVVFYLLAAVRLPLASAAAMQIVFFAPLLGGVLALFCTQRANPAGIQYDMGAAAVVELTRAAVAAAIPGTVLFLLFVFLGDQDPLDVFVATLAMVFMAAAVRGGTLSGSDVGPTVRARRYFQVIVGAAAGVLALTLLVGLTYQTPDQLGDMWSWGFARSVALPYVGAALGLASAFARIDAAAPLTNLAVPTFQRQPASGLLVAAGLVLLLPVLRTPATGLIRQTADYRVDTLKVSGDSSITQEWQFRQTPAHKDLVARSSLTVIATIPEEDRPRRDYTLTLRSEKDEIAHADDPPVIETTLPPGRYHFRADRLGGQSGLPLELQYASLDDVLSTVALRATGSLYSADARQVFTLRVTTTQDWIRKLLQVSLVSPPRDPRQASAQYQGTAVNLGYSWDAPLPGIEGALDVSFSEGAGLTGDLSVHVPLGGSGPFSGVAWRDTVLLASVSQSGDTILWLGRVEGPAISGPYLITGGPYAEQRGRWRVTHTGQSRIEPGRRPRPFEGSLNLLQYFGSIAASPRARLRADLRQSPSR